MNFNQLVLVYRDFFLSDPITMTSAGIHDRDHELCDLSEKSIRLRLQNAKATLRAVDDFGEGECDLDEKVDVALMRANLQRYIFTYEMRYHGYYDWEIKPFLASYLHSMIFYLLLQDPRDASIRLDAILSRLKLAPDMISSYKGVLKAIVRVFKEAEIEEIKALEDLYNALISFAKESDYNRSEEILESLKILKKSIIGYVHDLEELEELEDFSIGEENADELIKANGMDLNLRECLSITKKFYLSNEKRIDELCEDIKKKYKLNRFASREDVILFLKEKFNVPVEKVLDYYKEENERLEYYVKESSLFTMPEKMEIEIVRTPKHFSRLISTGMFFPPAPFEKESRKSVLYLNVKEDSLYNILSIKNTMIHEGIPGHLLQFSCAFDNPSDVRKLSFYSSHAEGWATYAETMMANIGYIPPSIKDEYLLITYWDLRRIAARAAMDLYFMSGDYRCIIFSEDFFPRSKNLLENAKDFLIRFTDMSKVRATQEIFWFCRERTNALSYLIGNRNVNSIAKEMVKELGRKEGTRYFHLYYLKEGIMPFSLLRNLMQKEVEIRNGKAES